MQIKDLNRVIGGENDTYQQEWYRSAQIDGRSFEPRICSGTKNWAWPPLVVIEGFNIIFNRTVIGRLSQSTGVSKSEEWPGLHKLHLLENGYQQIWMRGLIERYESTILPKVPGNFRDFQTLLKCKLVVLWLDKYGYHSYRGQ